MNREQINAQIQKQQILLDADGSEYNVENQEEVDALCSQYDILWKYIQDEKGLASEREAPPSIKAMQKLELADYELASDSGHFRFYPKGNLVFDLIKDWADEIALNRLGAMKIETPLIYDYNEPDIKQQVQSFHERHYEVKSPGKDKDFILRFAGDFGLFRMMKDAKLSYRSLPARIYEYSKSFRYEKSGELAGLKRLRAFSMPDIHSFTADLSEGFKEYKEIYRSYFDLAKAMEIQFVSVFRMVESFYHQYKEEVLELVRYGRTPVFIELLSDMKHYWAIKSEFNAIDGSDSFTQLSTVQLDVKDADIYGIRYTDASGEQKGCIICHSSIGSIERWMYAILEAGLKRPKPELPYWLSPVQLRVIPVSGDFLSHCEEAAKQLRSFNIRVDVDDRRDTLGKKIRNAEQMWVPFLLIVGEKEIQSSQYSLRARAGRAFKPLSLDEIGHEIQQLQNKMPFRQLNMNLHVSRQPIFWG